MRLSGGLCADETIEREPKRGQRESAGSELALFGESK